MRKTFPFIQFNDACDRVIQDNVKDDIWIDMYRLSVAQSNNPWIFVGGTMEIIRKYDLWLVLFEIGYDGSQFNKFDFIESALLAFSCRIDEEHRLIIAAIIVRIGVQVFIDRAFTYAVSLEQFSVASYLHDRGANINAADIHYKGNDVGYSPIEHVIRKGKLQSIEYLLNFDYIHIGIQCMISLDERTRSASTVLEVRECISILESILKRVHPNHIPNAYVMVQCFQEGYSNWTGSFKKKISMEIALILLKWGYDLRDYDLPASIRQDIMTVQCMLLVFGKIQSNDMNRLLAGRLLERYAV